MIAYTELFTSFVPTATGWQNYDIFTNKGVPKGAIAEIVIANSNLALDAIVGVRTDGSALARYKRIHEAEGGGVTTIEMLVKVDVTTGLIEIYCNATTGVTFYLVGYWTGVDFTETFYTDTAGVSGSWNNADWYTDYGIPKGRVVQVCLCNKNQAAATIMGARIDGSALNRSVSIHECEGVAANGQVNSITYYVKTTADTGIVELYSSTNADGDFVILGYFDNTINYVESVLVALDLTVTGWTSKDLTSYLDQDGRVVTILCMQSDVNNEHNLGARKNGSSLARYILEHEPEANLYTGFHLNVETDTGGVINLYCDNITYDYFQYVGYFKPAVGSYSATVSASLSVVGAKKRSLLATRSKVSAITATATNIKQLNLTRRIAAASMVLANAILGAFITTLDATEISQTTVVLHGNITIHHSTRGFDWGSVSGGYSHDWSEEGSFEPGNFEHTVENLDAKTEYFFRAKAIV